MRRHFLAASLLTLALTLFFANRALAEGPAPVADLRAQSSVTSVILTWTHNDPTADHYEVWWSDSPYAAVGDAGMVKIATVTPIATPSELTYIDTASGVGNAAVNSFYAVRGVTEGGEAGALSNRAGEFDFGVSVDGAQPAAMPVVDHCGTISADQAWGPNSVHRLTCDVTVAAGVRLLVLPGTVVKFAYSSASLTINGTLDALGTTENPIAFTSRYDDTYGGDTNGDGSASTPAPGDWGRIDIVDQGQLNFDHVVVRYGGAPYYAGYCEADQALLCGEATEAADAVSIRITNSTVEDSAGYGLYLYDANGTQLSTLAISNSTFQRHAQAAVLAGNYLTDVTITDSIFSDTPSGRGADISNQGAVTFSGNTCANNRDGCHIRGDDVVVTDNSFTNYADRVGGVVVSGNLTLSGNTVSGPPRLFQLSGTVQNGLTLDTSIRYFGIGSLRIPSGQTLTVQPGVVVKFEASGAVLGIGGTLNALGTAENPIVFTSRYDDTYGGDTNGDGSTSTPAPGDWGRIEVYDQGQLNFDHVVVRYGGAPYYAGYCQADQALLCGEATEAADAVNIRITNSTVEDSAGYGLYLNDNDQTQLSTLTVSNSTFQRHAQAAVLAGSYLTAVSITDSIFSDTPSGRGAEISNQGAVTFSGNTCANNRDGCHIRGDDVVVTNNSFTNYADRVGGVVVSGNLTLSGNTVSGPPRLFQLSGTVQNDLTLDTSIRYFGIGHLTIPSGQTLTVQPGVVVKFDAVLVSVLGIGGTLNALGTAENPIVFTSRYDDTYGGDTNGDGSASTPAAGDWERIEVYDQGQLNFDHVVMRYGGAPYYGGYCEADQALLCGEATEAADAVSIRITNSTVEDSASYGLYLYDANGTQLSTLAITNSTFQRHAQAAVLGGNYLTAVSITDSTFSDTPSGRGVEISNQGAVTFSGNICANNRDGCHIRGEDVVVTNNSFTNYADRVGGVVVSGNLTLSGNTVSGPPRLFQLSGTVQNGLTLDTSIRYFGIGSLRIPSGQTLTVQPGVVVKFEASGAVLGIGGTLNALGTAENPIVFTSRYDDTYGGDTNGDGSTSTPAPGDWGRIEVYDQGQLNFDHVVVRYGGAPYYAGYCQADQALLCGEATEAADAVNIRITNSTVEDSAGYGLYLNDNDQTQLSTLTVSNSTFQRHAQAAVLAGSYLTAVSITDSIFSDTPSGRGAEISNQGAVTFSGNTCANNRDGCHIRGDDVVVTNNSFTNYADRVGGVVVSGNLTLSGNTVSGPPRLFQLSGTVQNDLTLDTSIRYFGIGHLTIPSGQTLTVQPGVVVKFDAVLVSVLGIGGTLNALGTAENPIVFTSRYDDTYGGDTNGDGSASTPAAGDWERIEVYDQGQLNFDHVVMRYGGAPYYGGYCEADQALLCGEATEAADAVSIRITNSTVEDSASYGLYLYDANGTQLSTLAITNSTFQRHAQAAVLGGNYLTAVSITDSTFSDTPSGRGVEISNQGAVTFSGNICANNRDGCHIRGEDVVVTNNSFTNYADRVGGVVVSGNLTLSGNTVSGPPRLFQLSGTVQNDLTLDTSIRYFGIGHLTIPSGQTLTVQPGVVVKFDAVLVSVLGIGGTLNALGTAENPIVFTSRYDDTYGGDTNGDGSASTPAAGDWERIEVYDQGQLNFDHVVVRYGGAPYYAGYCEADQALLCGEATEAADAVSIRITNSTVEDSAGYGLYLYDANGTQLSTLTVSNSTFRRHNGTAIYSGSSGIGFVGVSGSNIYANGGLGLAHYGSYVAMAENNWWGSDSGPAPYGTGNGISYGSCYDDINKVYYICHYYVDADPWLGKTISTGTQLGNTGPLSSIQAFIADPVNTANGNYSHQHTDLAIATRGLPLDFSRAYNSLNPAAGPLGYGWTHDWNMRLSVDASDGSVTISFPDGHSERWTWTGTAYDGGPGVYGVLTKNGDGTFDLLQKNQATYHFEVSLLTWVEDKNASRTTLTYDSSGRLITITEPAGRTLTLAYASPIASTLISSVTDHSGRGAVYTYDANADLVTVVDVTGQPTTFTYDAAHRMLTATDANTHRFVHNVYDANGRVFEQYDALDNKWIFAYDEPAHKTLVTDPRGHVTTYQYDGDWRLTSEKDALNYTTSYTYDADNNRIQVTDKRGNATDFAYDVRGNITGITDALDHTRSFTYDTTAGRNNLLSETDPRGHTTTYAYDSHSNLLTRTDALGNVASWTYTTFGQVETATDARDFTTGYTYDAYGYPATVTDPLDHTTTFVYDSRGRKTSETDAKGRTRSYAYDLANRLLSVTEPLGRTTAYAYDLAGNRTAITENGTRTTQYAYDAKDRLIAVTDPLGHATSYGYDSVDNQISVTDALGHVTTTTYDAANRRTGQADAMGHTTGYGYDANGNRTSMTDANSKTTQYAYDELNRLIQVTDAANGVVQYGYDEAGNRISLTNANNHTTGYAYDELNRLTSTTDPLSHVTGYGYDAGGNRISQVKPDGTTLAYTYDALGRLATITYGGGSVAYAYDAVGNRTTLTDPSGVTTYTYDDLDRLMQVTSPNGTAGYGYDLFDNRTALTYPGSKAVTYDYDLAGRLTTVTDWDARVTTYSYDAANRPDGVVYPNGVQAVYIYDDADRLLSVAHTHPTNGSITSASYTVDAVGNRLSMTDPDGATAYNYDNLYRLTGVTYPDGETVSYAYDPMGNRTSLISTVHGTTTYTYDASDRLLTAGATAFTWDDNGRMTGKGAATYAYDPLDRLTQVVDGATTVQFTYNGDGVRLSKTADGTTTAYLQDLQSALPVVLTETTGGQSNAYLYGMDLLAQIDPAGNPAYYHADGLGSTRALSDAAGQRTDGYTFDVFGAVRSHAGSAAQPFMFAGEQWDEESALFFLRARYYGPALGRFMSKDAIGGIDVLSQTLNHFVYAGNNPNRYVDPTGNLLVEVFSFIPGVGILAQHFENPDAPPAGVQDLPRYGMDIAETRELVSLEFAYSWTIIEGLANGTLLSLERDKAVCQGFWSEAEKIAGPFYEAFVRSRILPNLWENIKDSFGPSQAYAAELYYLTSGGEDTMGRPPSRSK